MSGDGQESTGSERLDRIERALELLINDHVTFREEHKQLLSAQVLLTGSLERLSERVEAIAESVETLAEKVETLAEKVETLADDLHKLTINVASMQSNFDARLKRLET